MPKQVIQEKLRALPDSPGVYRFLNKDGQVIYVGKAKNLKNRVSSYFVNTAKPHKVNKMVSEAEDLQLTLVNSEMDALLLENNLIKELQPKYNFLLRDDKSYPYICISKEPFPKVYVTRKKGERAEYFGPFANGKAMDAVMELFREVFTLRTCSLDLSPKPIADHKYKVCLEYHIKKCMGPCVGKQSESDYAQQVERVRHILKGNIGSVRQHFTQLMEEAAKELAFEKAQEYKLKLEVLGNFQSKSAVASTSLRDVWVFSISSNENEAFVNFMGVEEGFVTQSFTTEIQKKMGEEDTEILSRVVVDYLQQQPSPYAKRIYTNVELEIEDPRLQWHVPQVGETKQLIQLSLKNALFAKQEKMRLRTEAEAKKGENIAVVELKNMLGLKTLPKHIECFDNSNFQGTNAVSSMVCFVNGKPAKKEYRKFEVKTVEGPDDFASMREVVGRRYRRVLDEQLPLPDLIVIDGGKGQLSSACEALDELGLYNKIPIIGLAKRIEEVFFPNDPNALLLGRKSRALFLLQQIRDEAHRFAITFHRDKRSKNALVSELDSIKGIGPKTYEQLIQRFGSVKNLRKQSLSDLESEVGKAKAALLWAALHEGKE